MDNTPGKSTSQSLRDYQRIAAALEWLEAQVPHRPSLTQIAASVDLSPWHFQRLFCRWVGLSPKRYVRQLDAAQVEQLLQQPLSLLEVAEAAGLSSPSRLHELIVGLHAMTPDQWRRGGEGLTLHHGIAATALGWCQVVASEQGLHELNFVDTADGEPLAMLRQRWSGAILLRDDSLAQDYAQRIFVAGQRTDAPLSLWLRGSAFQVRVWEALLRIPPGHLSSYQAIAAALGQPTAARAVGQAVGANPLAVLVPCHRVIRASGALSTRLGGYRWGRVRKRALLTREAAQALS